MRGLRGRSTWIHRSCAQGAAREGGPYHRRTLSTSASLASSKDRSTQTAAGGLKSMLRVRSLGIGNERALGGGPAAGPGGFATSAADACAA
eukprot:CAMPEP_0184270402 /NCGR_PEP_ID=MMETSP0977-20130417/37048_1 /TAXON_ID=483370 /ORGANISM="non described non described, Strain CCMP2097" /LENGTH=90 /DNA_ID=CAMNT_0026576237 /DNA_START=15 /DNA_END=284 /DNA_ORIENTATION=-